MFLSSSPSSPPSKKSRLADDNTNTMTMEPSAAPSCSCMFPPNDNDIIATISIDDESKDATTSITTETAVSTPELLLLLFDIVHQIPGLAIDIYSYLQPQDLCRLGMTGKVFAENVSSVRNKVLQAHLPIHLSDTNTNDEIHFNNEGHSFTNKSELHEFMIQRFDTAGILVRDTQTRERSMERARHLFQYQNWCHLILPEHTFNALAECHIDEIDTEYGQKILDWNDCRGVKAQHEAKHKFVMDWVRYLLAENKDATTITRWNWISNHPNFRNQSVRGTGIMIETERWGEKIEIRWDKKFMKKGSIFDSNLHRRVPRQRRIEQDE